MSDTLKRALDRIERPLLVEPSVKFIGDEVRADRFLVSFPRSALGPGPSRALREVLHILDAPDAAVASIDTHQSRAMSVHFGHEDDGTTKCYLEFDDADRPFEDAVFVAIKWRGEDWTVSHYLDRTNLPEADRRALMADILPDEQIGRAMARLDRPGQTLLEVIEPGTPRRSIDLNMAQWRTTLGAEREALMAFLGATSAEHIDRFSFDSLGHVAAGVARDGRVFTTLYHGAYSAHGPL